VGLLEGHVLDQTLHVDILRYDGAVGLLLQKTRDGFARLPEEFTAEGASKARYRKTGVTML